MTYDFSTEELMPVVAMLSEKYTCGESSSITYDRARGLLGAVMYCINEVTRRGRNTLSGPVRPSPEELYNYGYDIVLEKTRQARQVYNELVMDFRDYGNEFYHDTVLKGIPGFFLHYDARFAPQDHLLTLDYPVLADLGRYTGIDIIEKYLDCICLEHRYLSSFDEGTVYEMLESYDFEYRESLENIAALVLGKQLERDFHDDYVLGDRTRLSKDVWFCLMNNDIKDSKVFQYLVKEIENYRIPG